MKCQKCKKRITVAVTGNKGKLLCESCKAFEVMRSRRIKKSLGSYLVTKEQVGCNHDWNADPDNDGNFCVKCDATQNIYTGEVTEK